jgi:predicted transcriptional regulator
MKGLIIKQKWAELILNNHKTMELRGNNTKIRGTIGIIISGTKQVYGTVDLIDCLPLNKESYENNKDVHKVDLGYEELPYKNTYGWILENPVKYDNPISYHHKQGCVIWVNI